MAIHLEAVDLGVWRVTRDRMNPIKNLDKPTKNEEKEIHLNARAKNCLFESFSEDVLNQVFTLNTAHEIWLKLQELHDGTSNVYEQKYCLARQTFDSFEMNDDELVCDMYSRLNLIVNELNSIGLTKLGDADIVRKIMSALPQKKYASIITILHNMEDLSTMTPAIVIGKIVAFEISRKMGQEEGSSSSKDKALACSKKKKMKSKWFRQAQAQVPQMKMKKKMRIIKKMRMNQVMMINLPPPPPTLMKNQSNLSTRWIR
jgi:hypothetical protein